MSWVGWVKAGRVPGVWPPHLRGKGSLRRVGTIAEPGLRGGVSSMLGSGDQRSLFGVNNRRS